MRYTKLTPALLFAGAMLPAAGCTHLEPPQVPAARASVPTVMAAPPAAAPQAQYGASQWEPQDQWGDRRTVRARLWVDGDREWFRTGDRLRVRFSTSHDAHVAIVHIDPDGYLDFLFPYSPWESDYVRGGRTHTLARGYTAGLPVRGRGGIGYIYMIASPVPLDYRSFARGRASAWDWSLAGRSVIGDPFWAMEQITRQLLPHWNVPYAVDYYTYHVDGRHRYPYYACASNWRNVRGGWGWSSGYSSCDRLDLFLRQNPYYYDTRQYRGDRRSYVYRAYGPPQPDHRFKEPPAAPAAAPVREDNVRYRAPEGARSQGTSPQQQAPQQQSPQERPQVQQRPPAQERPTPTRETSPRETTRTTEPQQQTAPAERQRPTLERREPQREPAREAPREAPAREPVREPVRERPQPQAQPQQRPQQAQPQPQPQAPPAAPPQRAPEPRRDPEPRRESPAPAQQVERSRPEPAGDASRRAPQVDP